MKHFLIIFLYLVGLQAAASEVKHIENLYEKWREAVATADINSYVSVLDKDIRLIPPGADVIAGTAQYAKFLEPVFALAHYKIEVVSPPMVQVLDDIAVAEYEYVIHLDLKDPTKGVTESGALTESRTEARYFDVLKKNENGEFRVWRHTWQ